VIGVVAELVDDDCGVLELVVVIVPVEKALDVVVAVGIVVIVELEACRL